MKMGRGSQILQLGIFMVGSVLGAGCSVNSQMNSEARKNTEIMLREPTPTLVAPNVEIFEEAGKLTVTIDGVENSYPLFKYNNDIPILERISLGFPEKEALIEETPLGTFLSVHRSTDPTELGGVIPQLNYGQVLNLYGENYIVVYKQLIPYNLSYGSRAEILESFYHGVTDTSKFQPLFLSTCTLVTDPNVPSADDDPGLVYFFAAIPEKNYEEIYGPLPSSE